MPKRLPIVVPTPIAVYAATQAFASELRVHLIRFYAAHPGRQADAVRALGVERAVISSNTKALLETGAVVRGADRVHRVDQARLEELIGALAAFAAADE